MNDQHVTDRDLKAAFAARAAGTPNPDLAGRISAEAARTRQSRPLIVLPGFAPQTSARLAWAAALAALTIAMLGVLAFGAGRDPTTSVVPSEPPTSPEAPLLSPSVDPSIAPSPSVDPSVAPSAPPSIEPSPQSSAEPSAPPAAPAGSPFIPVELGPDTIGRVVATDGLRVRTAPTVGAASEPLEPTLDEGVPFYVVDGPVIADGYAWYQIDPYGGDPALTPFGWVAAGSREGERWIENYLDGCDAIGVSVELLGPNPPQESLYCYGAGKGMGGDIELTANLYCDFGDIDGLITGPEWLEYDRYCEMRAPDWTVEDGVSLRVWGQAATSLLEQGSPVDDQYTVVGHFDDPASSECRSAVIDGDAPDPAEVVLNCRMMFVVTEVTPAS